MFVRQYRVKSSVQLKTSEKKKFRHHVEECYSANEEIPILLPTKANIVLSKVIPYNEDLGIINVYSIDKVPLFIGFDDGGVPIPTIHSCWKIPNLVPNVMMPYVVLDKLLHGAHLMLPGIFPESLPNTWSNGDVVCVSTPKSGAAVAVGVWVCDKEEAMANGMKGKGVHIYHCYQDQLWYNGSKDKLPLTPLPKFAEEVAEVATTEVEDGNEAVSHDPEDHVTEAVCDVADNLQDVILDKEPDKTPDEILLQGCYRALKTSLDKSELPILTSTFYSKHVKPSCETPTDIKQTSYKKVGILLKELQENHVITVKEQKKGVFMITEVDFKHSLLRGYSKITNVVEDEKEDDEEDIAVVEAFICNGNAFKFFSLLGYKKGDVLNRKEMRCVITEYIKRNNLMVEGNKKLIQLDPILSSVMKTRDTTANWNEVMQRVEAACGKCYIITLPDKFPITVKGKLPPIEFKVEKRTGNKKVTIVSNFGVFGIDAKELAHRLQILMSSSATVEVGPGAAETVLVQGDARRTAAKLLLEEYKIPRKYVSSPK